MKPVILFRQRSYRQVGHRRFSWLAMTALTLVFIASGGRVDASASSAPATVPPNASPSEVYRKYQEYQRQQKVELLQAAEALRTLAEGGREKELERAQNEILESTDPETMTPFITRAQAQKWQSIPAGKRNEWFARYLGAESFPSQLEVRSETIDGDQATLEVRGYFAEVDDGEPGWSTGSITLAMEGGRWKVEDESWDWAAAGTDNSPGSADANAGAAQGSFVVSGAVERVVATAAVTESKLASHGGWNFSLHDEGYVVMLMNIPSELAVGGYPFAADMPSVPHDWDWETPLDFPLHVVLAERDDDGGLGKTWDDDMTGMLTVEAIEGDKMSGQFEFTDGSVKVLGLFRNVGMPASPESTSVVNQGESIAQNETATYTNSRITTGRR